MARWIAVTTILSHFVLEQAHAFSSNTLPLHRTTSASLCVHLPRTRKTWAVGARMSAKSNQDVVPVEEQEATSTLYEVLDVPWGASQQEVRKAYGKLAKMYHPDVTGNDQASTEYFYVVKNAYDVLSDEILRARYNNALMAQGYVPPKGSARRGQEMGMSDLQFFLVVILVNPFYLFLLGPLFGIKVEDVKAFLGM
jgi:hypothetical protein